METDKKKRPSILVVDDEAINIEVIAHSAGNEYEILAATSGREALEIAGRSSPDLVLLDVSMPEMDGYETFKRMKETGVLNDAPVIFVTALGSEEFELKGLEMGAVDYLIKPIRPAVLRQRIKNMLELKFSREILVAKALELQELNRRLQIEMENVKTLRGLLPICCVCKKIRDDKGYWNQLEIYISENADVEFSHGYCPECLEKAIKEVKDSRKT